MLTARKHKISRLEEFSDAVFGFALTLLALAGDVPRSYNDLVGLLWGLPAFACCFALLVWLWREHDSFFERYPLNDGVTVVLNSLLLFVVLVYIYPLKFMFDALMQQVFKVTTGRPIVDMQLHELANASMLYGLGFFMLMGLFALLYLNAWRRRADLDLSEIEAFDARTFAGYHMVSAGVGLFAFFFALVAPLHLAFLSPSSFALLGPGHGLYAYYSGKRRQAVLARHARPVATAQVT